MKFKKKNSFRQSSSQICSHVNGMELRVYGAMALTATFHIPIFCQEVKGKDIFGDGWLL
jgi:hypothetical protein